MSTAPGRDRGFALLIVLWTVVLLSVLGTQITAAGRGEAQLARNLRDAAAAEAAADGAVFEAVFHALDTGPGHWPANGAPRSLRSPAAVTEVRILNEAGKVNLNSAPAELLAALVHAVGVDTQAAATLAAAILDWRFIDAQRGGGAKTEVYRAAGRTAGPPSAPFQSLEELGLVLGMTPDLVARLSPHLTLFHDGPPNLIAATPLVRRAMAEAAGGAGPDAAEPPDESVIAITARAAGPGGSRFNRQAVVRLGQRANGELFQVLTWDSGP